MPEIRIHSATGKRVLVDENGIVYHPKNVLEWRLLEQQLGSWDHPKGDLDTRFVRALLVFWRRMNRGEWSITGRPDEENRNAPAADFLCQEERSGAQALVELKSLGSEPGGAKWDKGFSRFYAQAAASLTGQVPGAFLLVPVENVKLDFRGSKKERLLLEFEQKVQEVCRGLRVGEFHSLGAPFHVMLYKVNSKDSYVQPTGRLQRITQEGITSEMSRLLQEANRKFARKGGAMGVVVFEWPGRGDLQGLGMGDVIGHALDSIDVTAYTDTDEVYVCADASAYLWFDVMQICPNRSKVTALKVKEEA